MSILGKRKLKDMSLDNDQHDEQPDSKRQKMEEEEISEDSEELTGLSTPPIANRVIVLNVGGVKYTTTLHTLTGYESMLKARFSGNFAMETLEDGSYFFDRDGTYFKYILKYLRTGKLLVPKWTKLELLTFKEEALYFQVTSLLNELSLKWFDSNILTNNKMKEEIISKINEVTTRDTRCDAFEPPRYLGSTDEWELQFDYDLRRESQRERKKQHFIDIMDDVCDTGIFYLILMQSSTNDVICGQVVEDFAEWFCFTCPVASNWLSDHGKPIIHWPEEGVHVTIPTENIDHNMWSEECVWCHQATKIEIAATKQGVRKCDFYVTYPGAWSKSPYVADRIEVWKIPSAE